MWLQYYLPAFTLPYYDYWVYPHRWAKSQVVFYPILLTSLAWVAFLWGYGSKLGIKISQRFPVPCPSRYTVLTSWVLLLIGIMSLLIATHKSGGLLQIAMQGSVLKGTGIWITLGFLTIPGVILAWNYKSRIAAVLAVIFYFTIINAAQGRGAALSVFILLLIDSYYLWNLRNSTTLLLGIGIAMTITVIASIGRLLTTIASLPDIIALVNNIGRNLAFHAMLTINRDISRIEQVSIILELVPSHVGYFAGVPMLQALLGPFAKYLIHDFLDWRIMLTAIALYGRVENLSWGFGGTGVGEWYVNFGLAGVIGVWLLFGVTARSLYEWFQRNRTDRNQSVLLALYVLLLNIFLGCVGETIGHLFSVWTLVPIVMSSHWYRIRIIGVRVRS